MAQKRKLSRKLREKLKAKTIAEVVKDTGRINLTEAHRRHFPNSKHHNDHCTEMLRGNVMEHLERLLRVRDADLLKKVTPEVIVQDLLHDINVLNELMEREKIEIEDIVRVLTAKAPKQKLLGMAIGMWKAEKPQEREKTAGELMEKLYGNRGGTN